MSYQNYGMNGHPPSGHYVQQTPSQGWPSAVHAWEAIEADPSLVEAIHRQAVGTNEQQPKQPRTFANPGQHQQPMFYPPPQAHGLEHMEAATAPPIGSAIVSSIPASTILNGTMNNNYQTYPPVNMTQHLPPGSVNPFGAQQVQQVTYTSYQLSADHPPNDPRIPSMTPQQLAFQANQRQMYMNAHQNWEGNTSPPGSSPTIAFSPSGPHSLPKQPTPPLMGNGIRIPPQVSPSHGTNQSVGKDPKRRRREPAAKREEPRPARDTDDDDDDEGPESPAADRKPGAAGAQRRACVICKKAKVRCVQSPGGGPCKRCRTGNKECTFEERKPPRNPNRREYYLAQIKEKDLIIESLLRELYNPYQATPLSIKAYRETAQRQEQMNAAVRVWRERLEAGAKSHIPTPAAAPTNGVHADDEEDDYDDLEPERGPALKGNGGEGPLDDVYPVAYFEELSIAKEDEKSSSDNSSSGDDADDVSVTRQSDLFDHRKSELLNHGLINEADVEELFAIYHNKLNSFIPLLDSHLHTPKEVFTRCPPLFSVICAITSRYYAQKSQIYPIAMHFAKNECSNALMHGFKSVELAQAFILLAFYSQPAKRWEEERGFVFGGLAMRMAIDLNLHITPITKPKSEKEEREQLNRLRLWMICFETDLNMAAHYGKPASLKENQIIRQSDDFYTRSKYVLVGDIGLAAYNKLLRVVYQFHTWAYSDPDSRTGLKKSLDFRSKGDEYDEKLDELSNEWTHRFAEYTVFQGDPIYDFRRSLLPYAVNYCRLVIFSFGFQQAFERGIQSSDRRFFEKCMSAAKAVVKVMVEKLAPSKYMQFAPTGWFNFSAFASAFLIKLLRPEFSEILREDEKKEILSLVGRLTKVLASSDVAIDDRHAPKLWSRFLDDLVAKRTRDNSTAEHQAPAPTTAPAPDTSITSPATAPYVVQQQAQQQQYHDVPGQDGYAPQPMPAAVSPVMQWAPQQPFVGLGYAPMANGFGHPIPQPQFDFGSSMVVDDDGTLAAMAAIGDQGAFWDNMMLPGFVWPESPQSIQDLPIIESQPDAAHAQQWFTSR